MHEPGPLEGFGERRPDIGLALGHLEDALLRPIGSPREWAARVGWALDDLATIGRAQIAALLVEGGPLNEAIRSTPRLTGTTERLRDSLPELGAQADDLQELLDLREPSELRGLLLPFVARVVTARQQIADVLWEAYTVDIGGSG